MPRVLKTAGKFLLIVCLFTLAACSTPTTPTVAPTQDLNLLRTEVASTVLAKVPQLCALTPAPTLPPTATATFTASPSPSATAQATTSSTAGTAINDRAKWVSQTILDRTRFSPGQTFNMTWTLQNAGTTTWTTAYSFRFWGGEQMGAPKIVNLDREVAPGETIDITVSMKAPAKAGEYQSRWVMFNAFQTSFKEDVYLFLTVVAPATLTPTAKPATATKTPIPATATPTTKP